MPRPLLYSLTAIAALATTAALAEPDFGNNSGQYPSDGECDDPRFDNAAGKNSMAGTLAINNSFGDASDCKMFYEQGFIIERKQEGDKAFVFAEGTACSSMDFGEDSGKWTNDNECDDPRFQNVGSNSGMADELVLEDLRADASDCRKQCDSGNIEPRTRYRY